MVDGSEIERERKRRGWSQPELAEQARRYVTGADPAKLVQQVVDRIESGRQSKYRNAVLRALDLPIVELNSDFDKYHISGELAEALNTLQDDKPEPARPSRFAEAARYLLERSNDPASRDMRNALAHGVPNFTSLSGPRDVEELGIAVGGEEGDFELNGDVISMQPRPPGLVARDVFAVRVQNDSMYPRFKDGELVYVERKREPAVGEDAVIEMVPNELFSPGRAFIKEIARKTPQFIMARQHNPKKGITYRRSEIKALYRVVPWNECFGV